MISVFSIIVFGSVAYAVLPIRKGRGIWCVNENPGEGDARTASAPSASVPPAA